MSQSDRENHRQQSAISCCMASSANRSPRTVQTAAATHAEAKADRRRAGLAPASPVLALQATR
jgi:hypothetical protein